MSLTSVLNNAVSGLNAAQVALRNTTNNISNVNTDGYARRVTEFSSQAIAGQGMGVSVSEVRRVVDEFLVSALRSTSSDTARYEASSDLHDRLQTLLGDPAKGTTIASRLDDVISSLANLPTDPSSQIRRADLVNKLESFGTELGRLIASIEDLRSQADRQISADLTAANQAITKIHELNGQILRERLANRETSALEDERDRSLRELSQIIDITTFRLSNGEVGVSTTSGIVLVDDLARQFVYEGPGASSAETQFSQITLHRVNPISGDLDPNGLAIDSKIQSGSLRGLLEMRDDFLPGISAEIGELAAAFGDELNAIHNLNIAAPPPALLTGRNSGVLGGDLHGFTGQATFYAFDAAGDVASQFTVDFDALAAGTTIDDVIAAVNAGLGGAATLALSDGVMSFAAGTAAAVGIAQEEPPSDRGGRGFSHFFGMNDLVQAEQPFHHDSGLLPTSDHGFTGQTSLSVRGPNNEEPAQFTLDFGAIGATMTSVLGALNAGAGLGAYFTFTLDSDGALLATPKPGYSGYTLEVEADSSARGTTGLAFSSMFGIGKVYDVHTARNFAPRADIKADPGAIALARVDASGSPAVNAGDGSGALALQGIGDGNLAFAASGALPALSLRPNDYVARILAAAGQAAGLAEGLRDDRLSLESEIERRAEGVAGVNLDEELSNMIVFQNAYNASARVIAVTRELFDTLLRL